MLAGGITLISVLAVLVMRVSRADASRLKDGLVRLSTRERR